MFNEPGIGFFEAWGSFILFAFLVFIGIWVFSGLMKTKTGKAAENGFYKILYPFAKWYDTLSYTARRIVGWSSLIIYCISMVALLIWFQS